MALTREELLQLCMDQQDTIIALTKENQFLKDKNLVLESINEKLKTDNKKLEEESQHEFARKKPATGRGSSENKHSKRD